MEHMMSRYEHWLLTQKDHVATLTLNRPTAKNILTAETLYELRAIAGDVRMNKEIWVVILQGAGKHFSLGIDIDMIVERLEHSEQANREFLRDLQRCLDGWDALPKPTIARLHGFCVGGGLMLALCCDFRIASERTIFGLPEIKLGIPMIMGTQRVTRVTGTATAKGMILLGERFNARTAQTYGLVHSVVPPQELDQTVDALAAKLTKLPPRTVGMAKQLIHASYGLSLRDSQELEIEVISELLPSPDLREAIASYREQRAPRFSGE
jgi:enoyl-CoA hydratase/carnithine racemase